MRMDLWGKSIRMKKIHVVVTERVVVNSIGVESIVFFVH